MRIHKLAFILISCFIFSGCSKKESVYNKEFYQGIDVSHFQGDIDWSEVAKDNNIQFVYIKATEGGDYQDKKYKYNIKGANKEGFLIGSYHYFKSNSSVKMQFDNFISVVNKEEQTLIPMVDVEEEINKDSLLLFCNLIEKHFGRKPMIYGTMRSYNTYCAPYFNNYYLMLGRYKDIPPKIKGKGHYNIWQFSDKGKVRGISGVVDLDRFHPDFNIDRIKLVY